MESEAKFSLELGLRTTEVDGRLLPRPVTLMGMFQEAAVWQAERIGRGPRWLRRNGLAWAMAHTRMRIESLPSWPAELKVTTWSSEMGRFLSRREFVIEHDGKVVARGSSLWALLDFERRKAVSIPRDVSGRYRTCGERALELPFSRPVPPSLSSVPEKRRVEEHHVDFNEHANNLALLGWLLERGWGSGHVIAELNLRLQRELRRGDLVYLHVEKGETDGERCLLRSALVDECGRFVASAEALYR
ncbi:MAG: hypothetical protein D6806_10695, partial [Deltaproteobacteria bacterium]